MSVPKALIKSFLIIRYDISNIRDNRVCNLINGYIDNIRIIKGQALYTTTFDVPPRNISETLIDPTNPIINLDDYSTILTDNLQLYIPLH